MKVFGFYGLKIPLPFNWQIEIWLSPKRSNIPLHNHPNIDSYLIFLGGNMNWIAGNKTKFLSWFDIGKGFSVPAGVDHGATGYGVFVNFERWLSPIKSSAAYDLRFNN